MDDDTDGPISAGDIIDTAGLRELTPVDPKEARKEVIRAVSSTLRKLDASDDDMADALEALLELAKERD